MTPEELNVCRVVLAAWREVEHQDQSRIEVWKRRGKLAEVKIMHGKVITASATIAVVATER